MDRYRLLSPVGRARGLGSAKSGFEHWWTQRITAVALVPLTVWFAAALIAHSGSDYAATVDWLGSPVTAVLVILLLIALFWHTALGLQVVIEDYVHSGLKIWALLIVRFACAALLMTGTGAMLRISFMQ